MGKHEDGVRYMSTLDIIKKYFADKKQYKLKMPVTSDAVPPPPPRSKINYLAIIMDDEVQEIMRAENRLAALLLSEPKFVEFDPDELKVDIGWTYVDGKFTAGE